MILASSKCVAYKAGFDSAIILCNVLTIIGIVFKMIESLLYDCNRW